MDLPRLLAQNHPYFRFSFCKLVCSPTKVLGVTTVNASNSLSFRACRQYRQPGATGQPDPGGRSQSGFSTATAVAPIAPSGAPGTTRALQQSADVSDGVLILDGLLNVAIVERSGANLRSFTAPANPLPERNSRWPCIVLETHRDLDDSRLVDSGNRIRGRRDHGYGRTNRFGTGPRIDPRLHADPSGFLHTERSNSRL
jgi:hypothetical protein